MSEIDDMSDAVETLDDAMSQNLEPIGVDDVEISTDEHPLNVYKSPWERLDTETDYKWSLFRHYRDSGPQRSFKKTAKHFRKNSDQWDDLDEDRDVGRMGKQSVKTHWADRVLAFDKDQERLYQLARSEAIRDMVQRHEGIIEEAIEALMVPVKALSLAIKTDPDFIRKLSKINKNKLIDLTNRTMRTIPNLMSAERLSRDMPTEIVGGVVEHQVVHSVDRDQIGEVLAVLGEAGVLHVGGSDSDFGEVVDAEVVEVHPVSAEGDD